ncbi:hypothetical protein D9758_004301 [Tetrapyrgos nigripes]|uniref:Aldehyde dehydrogenase domain-containing protein n=1 Tax=Tetrapyrgos nigripes TaxID=182062 RepID=A0A8H5LVW7_9AGAR|nr:hypothetical protein D9758_004301 [Tetrapyrgos nigripes]
MTTDVFKLSLDKDTYKGTVSVSTGLFIDGKFVKPVEGGTIDVLNPATGKVITTVSGGSDKDVDLAVDAATKAYKTSWGLKVPGSTRGQMLLKLASLVEQNIEEFAALESMNNGKIFPSTKAEVTNAVALFRYYAGWADKVHGKTIETTENKMAYTRHEPFGAVAAIIPWNSPFYMLSFKIGPALATGNTIVLKPSEITPLTALKFAGLVNEAGFPPGVVNIVNGYGSTVGAALASHPLIRKIAFTGSTLTGRKILEASAKSNLKVVSLELGGKSPVVVFDDADVEQAVKWIAGGIFNNMGQTCIAGSRIFVQEGVYDSFVKGLADYARNMQTQTGDPFAKGTVHGPQISETQFKRVMSYISSGKSDGANVVVGGEQHGSEGFFIKPTLFTECTQDMKFVKEEIFGPVAAVMRFKSEEEVLEKANDTTYGLGAGVFTQNSSRAIRVAHAFEAGSTFW